MRSEVTHRASDDIPADYCTNTVYHEVASGIVWGGPDFQNHANEVRDCFSGVAVENPTFGVYSDRYIEVRCYDMADAKPRPIKATSNYVPGTPADAADFGPSQVALVLAFYADRNIKSHRGHIYIGPWRASQTSLYAPSSSDMAELLSLGHSLFDVGGENVKHVVWSTKLQTSMTLQHYWVDNRWDTQRRRLPKASSRVTLAP